MRWSASRSPEALIRKVRNSFLVSLLLGVAACATVQEEFDQAKDSWNGAKYEEVVTRWGPPTRSATLPDGRQTHTWVSQDAPIRAPGPSVGVGVFGGSGGGGVGVGASFPFGGSVGPATACERTLTFQEGVLAEQSWTGDQAFCRFFKR
jgi:hypothetical protein